MLDGVAQQIGKDLSTCRMRAGSNFVVECFGTLDSKARLGCAASISSSASRQRAEKSPDTGTTSIPRPSRVRVYSNRSVIIRRIEATLR